MLLLDTDVMIDILRGHSPAITWLQALGQTPIRLPGLVAMELVQGCRTRVEQQRVKNITRKYQLLWPTDKGLFLNSSMLKMRPIESKIKITSNGNYAVAFLPINNPVAF